MKRFGELFKISPEEAGALLKHLRSAWRYEELVPQPEGYIMVPLRRIKPPAWAVREDLGNLEELKTSIHRAGLLQPMCVRPLDKEWRNFEPVMGVRRYFACRELRLERAPCFIRPHISEETVATLALEENRFRKDLTELELFRAIQALRAKGYTLERIAELTRLSEGDVLAYLKVPKLPSSVRKAFLRGEVSIGHIRVISTLPERKMIEILGRIKRERLSVGAVKLILATEQGELELPAFLSSERIRKLIGSKLTFRKKRGGISLKVDVSDEKELLEILREIVKSTKQPAPKGSCDVATYLRKLGSFSRKRRDSRSFFCRFGLVFVALAAENHQDAPEWKRSTYPRNDYHDTIESKTPRRFVFGKSAVFREGTSKLFLSNTPPRKTKSHEQSTVRPIARHICKNSLIYSL